jgi:hypothetical protein
MFAVHYADETIAAINVALNEAEVYGFELSEDTAEARLLVSVSTLPPSGPIDPDGRRIVVLSNPSRVRVLLRSGPTATASPPIPLAGLDELDLFFDSLSWRDAMYGWPFMDGSVGVADEWPAPVSLDLELAEEVGEHSLYWFAECGRNRISPTTFGRTSSRGWSGSTPSRFGERAGSASPCLTSRSTRTGGGMHSASAIPGLALKPSVRRNEDRRGGARRGRGTLGALMLCRGSSHSALTWYFGEDRRGGPRNEWPPRRNQPTRERCCLVASRDRRPS